MELVFEHTQLIGTGSNPSAIHTAENIVQVIFVGAEGKLYAVEASTPMGAWGDRIFSPTHLICSDVNVEYMKLKYSASSIFVVWKNATDPGEVVPYIEDVTHSMRHRMAIWVMHQDLSKYLIDGSLQFRLDDPVVKMSMSLENPSYVVSREDDTILTPGTSLTLYFRAGDSPRYIMGKYFIDSNDMSVNQGNTSVDGRNAIGKLLKDQTFDEDRSYVYQNLADMTKLIMDSFNVVDYYISPTDILMGMEFPPDMDGLSGMQELINATALQWKLEEDLSGRIVFGPKTDPNFIQPSTYTFYRDKDIFSRSVTRDDRDAYSRVCVYNQDRSIEIYKNIDFKFVMGRKKTLHVSTAGGTTPEDAEIYATELASLLGSVGTIETFNGPFRPYLTVGDNAIIISKTSQKLLGIITSVSHSFGKNGYSTEFVVDSGSVANRTRVSDYIDTIAGREESTSVIRLYE